MFKSQLLRRHHIVNIVIEEPEWTSKARRTALEAAGLDESAVSFIRTEETEYLGRKLYEVEFSGSELHYEYDIDAGTWEIVGQDFEPVEL
jgi:uncharacterized membrane protein YkoI